MLEWDPWNPRPPDQGVRPQGGHRDPPARPHPRHQDGVGGQCRAELLQVPAQHSAGGRRPVLPGQCGQVQPAGLPAWPPGGDTALSDCYRVLVLGYRHVKMEDNWNSGTSGRASKLLLNHFETLLICGQLWRVPSVHYGRIETPTDRCWR